MKKIILLTISVLIIFSVYTGKVKAQVVINEFSSWDNSDDWVELFNYGNTGIELSDYIIRDSTATNKIALSGNIDPGGFAVFGFSNRLNKSSDSVRLIKIENSEEIVMDSVMYGKPDQVCAPGENETIGRVPDGGNVLERFSVNTKNSTNNSALDPCPTPTQAATPTLTATPILTPTQTQKPTPAVSLTSALAMQQIVIPDDPTGDVTGTDSKNVMTESVLSDASADQETANSASSSLSEAKDDKSIKTMIKKQFLPIILIVAGITAMIYSLSSVIKKTKKKL